MLPFPPVQKTTLLSDGDIPRQQKLPVCVGEGEYVLNMPSFQTSLRYSDFFIGMVRGVPVQTLCLVVVAESWNTRNGRKVDEGEGPAEEDDR